MDSERALMEEELKHLQRRLKILERAMSTTELDGDSKKSKKESSTPSSQISPLSEYSQLARRVG
tara:strand:- start:974 stop:1165 length:192 start_codon:yes stop_codon:yes gene_type:complete